MHSIPPKLFAISQGVPHIFSQRINQLQKGWQRCRLFSKKKRVGGIIFGRKRDELEYKNTPPCVLEQKG